MPDRFFVAVYLLKLVGRADVEYHAITSAFDADRKAVFVVAVEIQIAAAVSHLFLLKDQTVSPSSKHNDGPSESRAYKVTRPVLTSLTGLVVCAWRAKVAVKSVAIVKAKFFISLSSFKL